MTKTLGVDIVGFGPIGRELATRLAKESRTTPGSFKIISISDSSATIFPKNSSEVMSAAAWKLNGRKLSDFGASKRSIGSDATEAIRGSKSAIVIDVTNSNYKKPEDARRRAFAALDSGKHFVTANKVALSNYFDEILAATKKKRLKIGFTATFLGARNAIIIARNLPKDEILSAEAILNASTTVILSRLEQDPKLTFDAACRIAADEGILESDWSIDLDGIDAAAKTAILANVLFPRTKFSIKNVSRTGIRDVKCVDLIAQVRRDGQKAGRKIRLVSELNRVRTSVEPRMIDVNSALAVDGPSNVVSLKTENFGEITVRNAGAGIGMTTSAITSDLNDAVSVRRIKHDRHRDS